MMVRLTSITRILVLTAYLVGHVGFSILDNHGVTKGGAFPCEGHACGCTSAEHCWEHCCCMSAADRLAWAQRNRVAPPLELVQAVARESAEHEQGLAGGACCSHLKKSDASERLGSTGSQRSRTSHLIYAFQAMKCRGHYSSWSVASEPALATSAAIQWQLQSPEVGVVSATTLAYESWGSTPPVPPG